MVFLWVTRVTRASVTRRGRQRMGTKPSKIYRLTWNWIIRRMIILLLLVQEASWTTMTHKTQIHAIVKARTRIISLSSMRKTINLAIITVGKRRNRSNNLLLIKTSLHKSNKIKIISKHRCSRWIIIRRWIRTPAGSTSRLGGIIMLALLKIKM